MASGYGERECRGLSPSSTTTTSAANRVASILAALSTTAATTAAPGSADKLRDPWRNNKTSASQKCLRLKSVSCGSSCSLRSGDARDPLSSCNSGRSSLPSGTLLTSRSGGTLLSGDACGSAARAGDPSRSDLTGWTNLACRAALPSGALLPSRTGDSDLAGRSRSATGLSGRTQSTLLPCWAKLTRRAGGALLTGDPRRSDLASGTCDSELSSRTSRSLLSKGTGSTTRRTRRANSACRSQTCTHDDIADIDSQLVAVAASVFHRHGASSWSLTVPPLPPPPNPEL